MGSSRSIADRLQRMSVTGKGSQGDINGSIQENLELILNSRRPPYVGTEPRSGFGETLLIYGLPDHGGQAATDPMFRRAFASAVEETIRAFEPRLRDVTVIPLESEAWSRLLGMRIRGLVMGDEDEVPVSFVASATDPDHEIHVREGAE